MKTLILGAVVAVEMLLFSIPSTVKYVAHAQVPATPIVEKAKVVVLTSSVTAYSSTPGQTDDTPFIMANGMHVHSGAIACPSKLAFGTRVSIKGKEYVCEDRMATRLRSGNNFDVWMASSDAAYRFGRQQLAVTVLSDGE